MAQISVIVPVYKVEQYLRKCVDSILSQSFQDFDLILVNDGSPDNCPAICDSYAVNDSRITVIHKENGGLSDARNAGIDWAITHSDSRWLAFVDSDDYVHPDYLLTLYHSALKESADLVICDFSRVDDQGKLLEKRPSLFDLTTSDKRVLFQCLGQNWRIVPAWNKLYAKYLFSDLRFEYGKIHEDEYAIHRVLWASRKTVILNQSLYYYRCRQTSIMATESTASRMDGLEATIEQYEFCLKHDLPPRQATVNTEYLNSVMELGRSIHREDSARFQALKQRYAKIYFTSKKNRTMKGCFQYYCNSVYRKASKANQALRRKGKPKHE